MKGVVFKGHKLIKMLSNKALRLKSKREASKIIARNFNLNAVENIIAEKSENVNISENSCPQNANVNVENVFDCDINMVQENVVLNAESSESDFDCNVNAEISNINISLLSDLNKLKNRLSSWAIKHNITLLLTKCYKFLEHAT